MKRAHRRDTRGFALVEMIFVVLVGGLGSLLALQLVHTTDELSCEARMRVRASTAYVRAHQAIAEQLANTAVDSLQGFDDDGASTQPSFQTVSGMEFGVPRLDARLEIFYERTTSDLGGRPAGRIAVRAPGATEASTLARSIREGSFRVRLEGRSLVIRLRAIHEGRDRALCEVEGETVVSLRN